MGAMSRSKGQRGERELAALIADLTGWDVSRRVRQHDGDSDIDGVPGWSVEVKRSASPLLGTWWAQTVAQATHAYPVLFYRLDRQDWRALWPVALLLKEQRAEYWEGLEWTCNTSVQAWAAVAREISHA